MELSNDDDDNVGIQYRVSSRNFMLGEKLTDHVAVRPRGGEGIGNILGGKLSCLGGGGGGGELPLRPPP